MDLLKMKILQSSKLTAFDVDETLIISVPKGNVDDECFMLGGTWWRPHHRHIHQLKAHSARDHTILVWSAGGDAWAERVIRHLDLVDYVDYLVDKPLWAYDDNKQWINWIYYKPNEMEESWD